MDIPEFTSGNADQPLCRMLEKGVPCLLTDDPEHMQDWFHPSESQGGVESASQESTSAGGGDSVDSGSSSGKQRGNSGVDISGNASIFATESKDYGEWTIESCMVEEGEIIGEGLKKHATYSISSSFTSSAGDTQQATVVRRFRDFAGLRQSLTALHPCSMIPPLPSKSVVGKMRMKNKFQDTRLRALQLFASRLCTTPGIQNSNTLQVFCTKDEWTAGEVSEETKEEEAKEIKPAESKGSRFKKGLFSLKAKVAPKLPGGENTEQMRARLDADYTRWCVTGQYCGELTKGMDAVVSDWNRLADKHAAIADLFQNSEALLIKKNRSKSELKEDDILEDGPKKKGKFGRKKKEGSFESREAAFAVAAAGAYEVGGEDFSEGEGSDEDVDGTLSENPIATASAALALLTNRSAHFGQVCRGEESQTTSERAISAEMQFQSRTASSFLELVKRKEPRLTRLHAKELILQGLRKRKGELTASKADDVAKAENELQNARDGVSNINKGLSHEMARFGQDKKASLASALALLAESEIAALKTQISEWKALRERASKVTKNNA